MSQKCTEEFHPVFSAKRKSYTYLISKASMSPFLDGMAYTYSKNINVSSLREAAQLFVGEHDFKNYMCEGTPVKSTVRQVYSFEIEEVDSFDLGQLAIKGDFIQITVCGSGFLKQMVRLLVGALIHLNEGKIQKLLKTLKIRSYIKSRSSQRGSGQWCLGVGYIFNLLSIDTKCNLTFNASLASFGGNYS